jgi:hypothetical protein
MASRTLLRVAGWLLRAQHADWARAMQGEADSIENEREALAFAWGCVRAALSQRLAAVRTGLSGVASIGLMTCAVAVAAGCGYLASAGAPAHYAWMNLLSLAFAVATFWLLPRRRLQTDELLRGKVCLVLGALLLIGSTGGASGAAVGSLEASAWWRVGPVTVNLVWLLLPALLVAADVRPGSAARRWALGGLLMAGGALVLLSEAWLLGLVAVVLGARAAQRGSRALALLAIVAAGLAIERGRAWQPTQALAFVDQVVVSGFQFSLAAGLGLALLQVLPLWPALRHREARGHGLVWGLVVVLSLPGWLPSPWVGFGGSFIVGYLLSLALVGSDTNDHPGDAGVRRAYASHRIASMTRPRTGLW